MATDHTLRYFELIAATHERVADALRADAPGLFGRATRNAAAQALNDNSVQLRARLGPIEVSSHVDIEIGPAQEQLSSPWGYPVTTFALRWHATRDAGLFPSMQAKLLVYPHSQRHTQLELEGTYDPPLGPLGDALDALGAHTLAERSVQSFLRDIAVQLERELVRPVPAAAASGD